MKKQFLTIPMGLATFLSGLLISQATHALPGVDIHLKANSWQKEYSGDIGQDDNIVTFDDLGFEKEQTTSFSLTFRHFVPGIPNFKIQQTTLDADAQATLDVGTLFQLTDTEFQGDVTTSLDLSHTDITAFYSFLYFDVGLTGRNFDTESSIEGSDGTNIVEETLLITGTIPMLYLGIDVDLPLTGVYINAEMNTVSFDGNSLQDLSAALGYQVNSVFPLTVEAGYRRMSLDLKELDDLKGDFSIDGLFVSLGLAF